MKAEEGLQQLTYAQILEHYIGKHYDEKIPLGPLLFGPGT